LHSRPLAAIEQSGFAAIIGKDMIFRSSEAAIAAFERRSRG
jgi:hypothetical protein